MIKDEYSDQNIQLDESIQETIKKQAMDFIESFQNNQNFLNKCYLQLDKNEKIVPYMNTSVQRQTYSRNVKKEERLKNYQNKKNSRQRI